MASAAVMAVTKRSIQAQKNRVPADTKTIKKNPGIRRGFESGINTLEEGEAPLGSPTVSQSVRLAIKKGLRHAVIAFSYRHYVAAYPPGRVHRAMSPNQNR